jgi:hypothetical protein
VLVIALAGRPILLLLYRPEYAEHVTAFLCWPRNDSQRGFDFGYTMTRPDTARSRVMLNR